MAVVHFDFVEFAAEEVITFPVKAVLGVRVFVRVCLLLHHFLL